MALPLEAQVDTTPAPSAPGADAGQSSGQDQTQNQNQNGSSDQMLTPPPVSGQTYPTAPVSAERSNYLRGGLSFTSAYGGNLATGASGQPVSEMSYSVTPNLAFSETTPRLRLDLSYAPGFTFYQKTSDLNAADQNGAIELHYRLSPHVTLSARDSVQKSSSVFNQADGSPTEAVSGGAQAANFSVVVPLADLLTNSGNVGLTYQFSMNGMIGASGTFSNLHYSNPAQVPGLYDSSTQGGSAFYSHRLSKRHYIGTTYQYQRLVASPTAGLSETQTHAFLAFYTLYPNARMSVSFFGGPQYADTIQPPLAPLHVQLPAATAWNPAAGGSLSWQGHFTTFAMSYSHIIAGGGGLMGAVHMENAGLSLRQQFHRALSASVAGGYAQNDMIGTFLAGGSNGHSLSGTVSLQRQFHERVNLQLGYTRLHQDYSDVAVLAANPNTNREFVSLSYQFLRPVGR
jgi:hypothetical protein